MNIKNASDEFDITSSPAGTTLDIQIYLIRGKYASN